MQPDYNVNHAHSPAKTCAKEFGMFNDYILAFMKVMQWGTKDVNQGRARSENAFVVISGTSTVRTRGALNRDQL